MLYRSECQPRDERQSWLHKAAVGLGNKRQIALAEAQSMTWEEIAVLEGEP